MLETAEDKAAKEARTRQLLAAYKNKMGITINPKTKSECEKVYFWKSFSISISAFISGIYEEMSGLFLSFSHVSTKSVLSSALRYQRTFCFMLFDLTLDSLFIYIYIDNLLFLWVFFPNV